MSKVQRVRKNAKYLVIPAAIVFIFSCLALGFLIGGFVQFVLGG